MVGGLSDVTESTLQPRYPRELEQNPKYIYLYTYSLVFNVRRFVMVIAGTLHLPYTYQGRSENHKWLKIDGRVDFVFHLSRKKLKNSPEVIR